MVQTPSRAARAQRALQACQIAGRTVLGWTLCVQLSKVLKRRLRRRQGINVSRPLRLPGCAHQFLTSHSSGR